MTTKTGAVAPADTTPDQEAGSAGRDSPKRQGDKLGIAGAGGGTTRAAETQPGDSPKRHGDKLQHAVDEALKG